MDQPSTLAPAAWETDGILPPPHGVGANLLQKRAQELERKLEESTEQLRELNRIGIALSAERDVDTLLSLILRKSRAITGADAGSLYLVEKSDGEGGHLRFKLTQNDSLDVPYEEQLMALSPRSIAGYVALTGASLRLADVYQLPANVPYQFKREFDHSTGYRSKSMLAVPMRTHRDEIIGVIQLINRKRTPTARLVDAEAVERMVIPFNGQCEELATSLASQAAVVLENNFLYRDIENLLEGFLHASVYAIESRDPSTKGHSERVMLLTVGLAEAVNRVERGALRDVLFTPQQIKEMRYAALLHDVGKIGVPEQVLTKPKKLHDHQLERLKHRFGYAKRTLEWETAQRKIAYLLAQGREGYAQQFQVFEAQLQGALQELDDYLAFILQCNEPPLLPTQAGDFDLLHTIAARDHVDAAGIVRPLLDAEEVGILSVPRGSLNDKEWEAMRSHVAHTYEFLKKVPWTSGLKGVPEIARCHHEKLDGSGYPHHLRGNGIPLQARMMTICDIYDALTAADRPYKRAVPVDRALDILRREEADKGKIDRELFEVFVERKVYQKANEWRSGAR